MLGFTRELTSLCFNQRNHIRKRDELRTIVGCSLLLLLLDVVNHFLLLSQLFIVECLVCLICRTNLASSDWDCCMLWNISYNRVIWGFTISYFGLHSCYNGELCGSALYYGLHVGIDGSSFRELNAFGGMVSLTKLLDSAVGLPRMLIRLTFATLPWVVCRWVSFIFFGK